MSHRWRGNTPWWRDRLHFGDELAGGEVTRNPDSYHDIDITATNDRTLWSTFLSIVDNDSKVFLKLFIDLNDTLKEKKMLVKKSYWGKTLQEIGHVPIIYSPYIWGSFNLAKSWILIGRISPNLFLSWGCEIPLKAAVLLWQCSEPWI